MTSRERIKNILTGKEVDRCGKAEAPWPQTRKRWRQEGLPEGVHPSDWFGMDIRMNIRVDPSFQLQEEVVDIREGCVLSRDQNGVLVKSWQDEHGIPAPLEYALKEESDWKELKGRLVPNENRFSFGYYGNYQFEYEHPISFSKLMQEVKKTSGDSSTFQLVETLDPYEATMARVGDENLLIWMATEPELVKDMFSAHADLMIESVDLLLKNGIRPDGAFVGGDIAYKNGMLFSPQMYRELLQPYHRKLFAFYHENDIPVIYHTDGQCVQAIPLLIESGVDCIEPLESQAGLDLVEIIDHIGDQLSFMGNVSVRALSGSKDDAVKEARYKLAAGKKSRGYIFHSDHSLPPEVPLENFQAVMEVFENESNMR